jgi:hypothetical protein
VLSILEVMEDIRRNPEEYAKEAVIGAAPYGDIARRVANGERVSAVEFGIETGLTFLPIGKIIKVGAQTGGKVVGKFFAAVAKRIEKYERKALKQTGGVVQEIKLLPSPPMADHHIFPQQFGNFFEKKG